MENKLNPPAPRATRLWDNILSIHKTSVMNLSILQAFNLKFNLSILPAYSPKFKYESFDPSASS